jgi:hypothetical protein
LLDVFQSLIGPIIWISVCGFAVAVGGRAEKNVGAALMVAWLTALVAGRNLSFLDQLAIAYFIIDLALACWILFQMFRHNEAWIPWAAGFQAIVVLVHLVTLVNVEIGQFAHISAQIVGTYGVLVCLAIGAFWSWQLREALRPQDGDT